MSSIAKLTVKELQTELKKKGAKTSGKKADLVARLETLQKEEHVEHLKKRKKQESEAKKEEERQRIEKETAPEVPLRERRNALRSALKAFDEEELAHLTSVPFVHADEPFSYEYANIFLAALTDDSLFVLATHSTYIRAIIAIDTFWKLRTERVYSKINNPLPARTWEGFWRASRPVVYLILDADLASASAVAYKTYEAAAAAAVDMAEPVTIADVHLCGDSQSFRGYAQHAYVAELVDYTAEVGLDTVVSFLANEMRYSFPLDDAKNPVKRVLEIPLTSPALLYDGIDAPEAVDAAERIPLRELPQ